MDRQNILTVEVDAETFEHIAPPLLRKLFEVDRIPSAEGGLALVSAVPFSAIVLRYPLQGIPTGDFLSAVRSGDSASRESKVVLLTDTEDDESATAFLDNGVAMVIPSSAPQKAHEDRLCQLLGIQPRQDSRILVKLQIAMENAKHDRFIAQTKDISVSGMFVVTRKRHPIGSPASFEFTPPDGKPIRGVAEVTRHSDDHARVSGMGFRFISFQEDSEERLRAIVEAQ